MYSGVPFLGKGGQGAAVGVAKVGQGAFLAAAGAGLAAGAALAAAVLATGFLTEIIAPALWANFNGVFKISAAGAALA